MPIPICPSPSLPLSHPHSLPFSSHSHSGSSSSSAHGAQSPAAIAALMNAGRTEGTRYRGRVLISLHLFERHGARQLSLSLSLSFWQQISMRKIRVFFRGSILHFSRICIVSLLRTYLKFLLLSFFFFSLLLASFAGHHPSESSARACRAPLSVRAAAAWAA